MRLAAFIRANIEEISVEWERFASTLMPTGHFSIAVLRDDIKQILIEIAEDMDSAQSATEERQKSEGLRRRSRLGAAEDHAISRIEMGLSPRQLASEFRALRATVVRLWRQHDSVQFDEASLNDLTRFNEAVDETLADAAEKYTDKIENSRDLFLGILSHDLRNPVVAISGAAEALVREKTLDHNTELAEQLSVSATRMSHLIGDLIELTRVRLGSGIPINRTPASMRQICTRIIEEMKLMHPTRIIRLNCNDELRGKWDSGRIGQVLSNLLANAVQHGTIDRPITLTARSDGTGGVELVVHNEGTPIPLEMLPKLFDRFYQGRSRQTATSLGLGLYIAKEIILAHGGTIDVQSSNDEGTNVVIRLPPLAFGTADKGLGGEGRGSATLQDRRSRSEASKSAVS